MKEIVLNRKKNGMAVMLLTILLWLVSVAGVVFGGESIQIYHLIGFPFIFARMIGVSAITIRNDRKKPKLEEIKQ